MRSALFLDSKNRSSELTNGVNTINETVGRRRKRVWERFCRESDDGRTKSKNAIKRTKEDNKKSTSPHLLCRYAVLSKQKTWQKRRKAVIVVWFDTKIMKGICVLIGLGSLNLIPAQKENSSTLWNEHFFYFWTIFFATDVLVISNWTNQTKSVSSHGCQCVHRRKIKKHFHSSAKDFVHTIACSFCIWNDVKTGLSKWDGFLERGSFERLAKEREMASNKRGAMASSQVLGLEMESFQLVSRGRTGSGRQRRIFFLICSLVTRLC